MIDRHCGQIIREYQKGYPVITITGPRQSGKTTLAKALFSDRPYVSFEDPDINQRAIEDPRNFLKAYSEGAVFDEIQRAPDLLSYLQAIIDEDTSRCRFILTGSQQFGLLSKITQTLAGRTALIHLLPFSYTEWYGQGNTRKSLDNVLLSGLYPPVHDRKLDHSKWYAQYVNTYIERDVRQLINIRDLSVFQRFLRLCAARSGGFLNLSNLGAETGVSHTTIKSWLSILEASYIIYTVPPHFENFGKRLVKTPKIYFYDTGLLCWLLSVSSAEQLNIHPQRGAIFESFVMSELMKYHFNNGRPSNVFFWRDKQGVEIDIIIEQGNLLSAIEIKSGSTFHPRFNDNLKKWRVLNQTRIGNTAIIYGGNESFNYQNISVFSWPDFSWLKLMAE
jgi:predicted AAA+ superfamily ATPase